MRWWKGKEKRRDREWVMPFCDHHSHEEVGEFLWFCEEVEEISPPEPAWWRMLMEERGCEICCWVRAAAPGKNSPNF